MDENVYRGGCSDWSLRRDCAWALGPIRRPGAKKRASFETYGELVELVELVALVALRLAYRSNGGARTRPWIEATTSLLATESAKTAVRSTVVLDLET